MFPIALLAPLAIELVTEFAPKLIGELLGDDAEQATTAVIGVARQVTGVDDPDEIRARMKDPDVATRLQARMADLEIAWIEAQAQRAADTNRTIRQELASQDRFKSYWRPAIGWVMAIQLLLLTIAIFVAIVGGLVLIHGGNVTGVTALFSGMSQLFTWLVPILGIELTVLGLNIAKRSEDKRLAAGHPPPPGFFGELARRIGRGGAPG